MNKLALVVMISLCGVAGAAPEKCDPFGAMHACSDTPRVAQRGSAAAPAEMPTPPPRVPPPVAQPTPAQLRQTCTDAMNADPTFAKAITDQVDKRIEQQTLDAHLDAEHHIQKNEKHVIYAYAAMWIIAALFVIFLWRRQQALHAEIAALRKDLEAASQETAS